MLSLGFKSLWNRRFGALLTVLSVALSVALILGVERLRDQARQSFANSASGLDLIVAARDNPIQILMATVFGVGSTAKAISWDSFRMMEAQPEVDWLVPISMGDNHQGFPVIGTTDAYFERFRHSGGQELQFAQGATFQDKSSAVVGGRGGGTFGLFGGRCHREHAWVRHGCLSCTRRGAVHHHWGTCADRNRR
jgi:putative ABC transport system permease protein